MTAHLSRIPCTHDASQVLAQLIARVPPKANANSAAIAAHAIRTTAEDLSRYLGIDGCHALLLRALRLASESEPILMNITFRTTPTFDVSGVTETIELYGVEACATALHSLLKTVIEVLARFVGDDIATRILERPNGQ